jgi:hypothetical protein
MTPETLILPEACERALATIELDPLSPGPETEQHLRICTACSEARVAFLAQEETPLPLAPAGYFDRLPGRILGKLPVRKMASPFRIRGLAWAAAAVLLMGVAAGAFWAGKANRTPVMEASVPKPADTLDVTVPDEPFHDRDEDAAQIQTLSPAEMKTLLQRLDEPAPAQR